MVSKYSKTKGYKPAHVDQARMEAERAQRIHEEFDAYERLLKASNYQPAAGHYRTLNGHHVQIVGQEGNWSRKEVSDVEQQLAPGYVWLPCPAIASPETTVTVRQAYLDEPSIYWSVAPVEVGFNDLGNFRDETGALYKSYQLRRLFVVDTALGAYYEAVPETTFDPSREHIRVYEDGRILCVPPIPQEFRCGFPIAPVQPQLVPAQQMPGVGLQQPMLQAAPQQMAEPQLFLDGSNSTPDSGLSFNSAAAPSPTNNANLANGVIQENGNAAFDIFDFSVDEVLGADFGNVDNMMF
ncbi:uncharacterized protein yc1106_09374 [Curvularia clavata]|uniref:Uncharacterized protein n=1 Tax=Curvularia clavata TaxID=95742 RepID=A0A9Q8ZI26_CURCL|nr:uncharacterized protein yc1106_09374 [Curvularia clavata]